MQMIQTDSKSEMRSRHLSLCSSTLHKDELYEQHRSHLLPMFNLLRCTALLGIDSRCHLCGQGLARESETSSVDRMEEGNLFDVPSSLQEGVCILIL
eukprot:751422-Hanusia_phi.AAC.7